MFVTLCSSTIVPSTGRFSTLLATPVKRGSILPDDPRRPNWRNQVQGSLICRISNPLGAKGAGEAGTVGALPAIVNAVVGALAPLGVKSLDMPATSERIWRAANGKSAG